MFLTFTCVLPAWVFSQTPELMTYGSAGSSRKQRLTQSLELGHLLGLMPMKGQRGCIVQPLLCNKMTHSPYGLRIRIQGNWVHLTQSLTRLQSISEVLILFKGLNGTGSSSSFTGIIVGRIQFLADNALRATDGWRLQPTLNLLLLQRAAHNMAAYLMGLNKWERKRESASKTKVPVFGNLISKVTAHPCCWFLFIKSESLGLANIQGEIVT